MPNWLILVIGLIILGLVVADFGAARNAWRSPSRWWRANEAMDSRKPAQPGNLLVGLLLGGAATIYGIVSLVH